MGTKAKLKTAGNVGRGGGRPAAPGAKVFTTGYVAALCGVAPRTVTKWADSGTLRAHRLPGSQDRRVYREDLVLFLRSNNMRVPLEFAAGVPAVCCCDGVDPGPEAAASYDVGDVAGAATGGEVSRVLFGCVNGLGEAVGAARVVRGLTEGFVPLAVLLGDDRTPDDVPPGVFDVVFTSREAAAAWLRGEGPVAAEDKEGTDAAA